MDPDDRVRTDAHLAGSTLCLKCQDHGESAGGSTLWNYATGGFQIPDAYVTTGTDGSYVTIVCQAYGEFDYGGSAVRDRTSDGLWVADYHLRTGYTDIVLDRCDSDPKPTGGGSWGVRAAGRACLPPSCVTCGPRAERRIQGS